MTLLLIAADVSKNWLRVCNLYIGYVNNAIGCNSLKRGIAGTKLT